MKTQVHSIAEKVAFLRRPAAYPYRGCAVTVKETHMSWVFLVNGVAYKMKKPVSNRLFDFTQPAARLKNCLDEVALNARLAKDIYLGVIALAIDEKGLLQLEGEGEKVDWLVKMKRLPEEQMLSWQIINHAVNERQVERTAAMLANFYRQSPAIEMQADVYVQKLHGDIRPVCDELVKPAYGMPGTLIREIEAGLLKYISVHAALLEQRVLEGRIIEGHGDLRPEHVFLGEPPAIIDCLEFNRDLRITDTAEELSYLAMECESMGNTIAGNIFFETYLGLTQDDIPASLVRFHKTKKALLRAYLVIRHIDEAEYKDDPKWRTTTGRYLQLANGYLSEL